MRCVGQAARLNSFNKEMLQAVLEAAEYLSCLVVPQVGRIEQVRTCFMVQLIITKYYFDTMIELNY